MTETDFQLLGEAFARLYSMALNGVVCDPADNPCKPCADAWKLGTNVLQRHDPHFAGVSRPKMFMPGCDELGRKPATHHPEQDTGPDCPRCGEPLVYHGDGICKPKADTGPCERCGETGQIYPEIASSFACPDCNGTGHKPGKYD